MPRGLVSEMQLMQVTPFMPVPWAVDYLRFKHDVVLSDQSLRLYVRKGRIESRLGPKKELLLDRESLDQFAATYKAEKEKR